EVVALGGLHVLGTERHEARRIDNQLRGRSGRQGDPGSSRFYLSLEDDLLRIFGAERITGLMERLGMEEDVPIEHKLVNRAIEGAQKRVEGHNFDIRKSLLDYDDVMNQQRKTIYALRRQVLEGRYVPEVGEEDKKRGIKAPPPPDTSGQWTIKSLAEKLRPKVAEIVDQYFMGLLRTDLAEGQVPTPIEVSPDEGDLKDPEPLTHELYRYFGAMIDYQGVGTERNRLVDHSCDQIARSLVQQRERVLDLADGLIAYLIGEHCPEKVHPEEWDLGALKSAVKEVFNLEPDLEVESMEAESLAKKIWGQVEKLVEARETELGPIAFLYFSRHFFLEEIDSQWIDHLKAMDSLREGIGLRGYGQKDPKQEYKKEGFTMFAEMMANIQKNVAGKLFRFQLVSQDQSLPEFKHKKRRMLMQRASDGAAGEKQKTVRRDHPKVGRNDPCPCGSGKKYKKCHGQSAPSPSA
ncbi:MAG: SEC-C domain-containing protein, partial [Deltaproteobacteria bacterium]|nr:SEC-C domain-containing protein [Deltaproteobacteria bacterium]